MGITMYKHTRMTLAAALLMVEKDSSGLRMAEIEARLEGIIRTVKALESIAPQQGAHKGMSVLIDRQCSLKTINRVATAIRNILDSPHSGEMPFWFKDTVRCYEQTARDAERDAEWQAHKLALVKTVKGWKKVELRDGRKVFVGIREESKPVPKPFDPSTD